MEGMFLDMQLKVSLLKQATRGLVVNRINGWERGEGGGVGGYPVIGVSF